MSPRTRAALALADARDVRYIGASAAWEARDHVARGCTRAVARGDLEEALDLAEAYGLLTDIYDRAWRIQGERLRAEIARRARRAVA